MNKKLALKYTRAESILEAAAAALITVALATSAAMYPSGAPRSALLWPITAVYIYLVVTGAGLIARRIEANTVRAERKLRLALLIALCAKTAAIAFALVGTYGAMSVEGG